MFSLKLIINHPLVYLEGDYKIKINNFQKLKVAYLIGWAGGIRTHACQSQSLVPYRLATAQYILN